MKSRLKRAGSKSPKLSVRETVLFALMGAALVCVQVALAVIPNVELVSLLIAAYSIVLGLKALYPVYVFVLIEGLIYGFGMWWLNYVYVWAVLVLAVIAFGKGAGTVAIAVISAIFGLLFGLLCSLPYLFIGGIGGAVAYFIAGIPFDIVHCIGNLGVALVLLRPAVVTIEKLYNYNSGV